MMQQKQEHKTITHVYFHDLHDFKTKIIGIAHFLVSRL